MYELRYSKAAQRYFKKVKEKGLKKAFQAALTKLAADPYCGTLKVGDLAGLYGYDVFIIGPIMKSHTVFMKRMIKSSL